MAAGKDIEHYMAEGRVAAASCNSFQGLSYETKASPECFQGFVSGEYLEFPWGRVGDPNFAHLYGHNKNNIDQIREGGSRPSC